MKKKFDKSKRIKYNTPGKTTTAVGGFALTNMRAKAFSPSKGGDAMVTYEVLFMILSFIVTLIALVFEIFYKLFKK